MVHFCNEDLFLSLQNVQTLMKCCIMQHLYLGQSIVVFFDPEVQRAWHMLILSPICYR